MRDDEKCRYVCVVIGWVLIAVLAVMCLGCKSVQYVPVETVRTDTCYVNKIRTDSVYVRDSVVVERGGDTIKVAVARAVRCAARHHLSEQDGQHCRTLSCGAQTLSVGKDEAGHRRHCHRCVHRRCVGGRDFVGGEEDAEIKKPPTK